MLTSLAVLVARGLLVALFLPFSALDKLLNRGAALRQAEETAPAPAVAAALIGAGLFIEVAMSLCVLTGLADRAAALVLALYCVATAVLWKRFWAAPDFRLRGPSLGRDVFWDFLKNLSVAGGFLLLALGERGAGAIALLHHPLASSHPYAAAVR